MRLRGPRATSPPAQMRVFEVRSVCGSTRTPPAGVRSRSTAPPRKLTSAAWPTARMTVSAGMTSSVPAANVGAKRPSASNTDVTAIVSSPVTCPVADEAVRSPAVHDSNAFVFGFVDLLGVGGDLCRRLQCHDRDVEHARSTRRPGDVERRGHRPARVLVGGRGQRDGRWRSRTCRRGAECRPRGVEGNVAAADDHDARPRGRREIPD